MWKFRFAKCMRGGSSALPCKGSTPFVSSLVTFHEQNVCWVIIFEQDVKFSYNKL